MSEDGAPTAFDLTLHASDPENNILHWRIATHNFATTYGNVQESDESNNLFGPVTSGTGSGPTSVSSQCNGLHLADLPQR